MLSNLPLQLRSSFAAEVVASSGLLAVKSAMPIRLFVVADRVQTPAEYELTGDLVLANESHTLFQLAASAFRLRPLLVDTGSDADLAIEQRLAQQLSLTDLNASSPQAYLVDEETLAKALDYPVALSDCREPMAEVSEVAMLGGGVESRC